MKVHEKTEYEALQVKASCFTEPGQKTIREFLSPKELTTVEVFPSRIIVHFNGGTRIVLFPDHWIIKEIRDKWNWARKANDEIKVLSPSEFSFQYEPINN